jgi:hypothetical protein
MCVICWKVLDHAAIVVWVRSLPRAGRRRGLLLGTSLSGDVWQLPDTNARNVSHRTEYLIYKHATRFCENN